VRTTPQSSKADRDVLLAGDDVVAASGREVPWIPALDICDIVISRAEEAGPMAMVKTPIEIDQEALTIAAEVLGTTTKKDTVNAALREVGQRLVRLRALARLGEMADHGDFDEFLGNKALYRR
jgi:Arc/MetJ family transcription regulator